MSTEKKFVVFTDEQIDKLGNALVYLGNQIGPMSKTKILKLIYILDELSIKKSGLPFFNLTYKAWQYGPVSEEIFIDLSNDNLNKLKSFISKDSSSQDNVFIPITSFNDDEFSNNDIQLMDSVIQKYGSSTATELIRYTHRENSPWYNVAKENKILELLESGKVTNTEYVIDLSELISHDERKTMIYNDYLEMN